MGGGIGSVLRYLVSMGAVKLGKTPCWGTLAVNLLGCLLIGYLGGFVQTRQFFSEPVRLALTVGFLGGLTTFSTFSFEVLFFIKEGKYLFGLTYLLSSCVLGICLAGLGYYIASRF